MVLLVEDFYFGGIIQPLFLFIKRIFIRLQNQVLKLDREALWSRLRLQTWFLFFKLGELFFWDSDLLQRHALNTKIAQCNIILLVHILLVRLPDQLDSYISAAAQVRWNIKNLFTWRILINREYLTFVIKLVRRVSDFNLYLLWSVLEVYVLHVFWVKDSEDKFLNNCATLNQLLICSEIIFANWDFVG